MSTKRLIYFTGDQHSVYRRAGNALQFEAKFGADEQGAGAFREFLSTRRGGLFTLVADLSGEDFHEDQIPQLRGSERQAVIQRRLAQRYRDTRLAAAVSMGFVSGERRNERLLLTSFTNTQQFTPWLDALSEAGARLAGVFSVPLLAPALAQRLGAREGHCLVVTATRAGLRQSFVSNGKLRFARLEQTVEMVPEALAMFVRSETLRLAQYLVTLRALPRDSGPVQAVVVAPAGERAVFESALVSDARLSFITVDILEAAKAIGLKEVPGDALAEALYLHLAARRPPKEQFARQEDRRGYRIWQWQRGLVYAGLAAFAGCALATGSIWLDRSAMRDLVELQQRDARIATERYERITRGFPVTHTTTDNLKVAVSEFSRIAKSTALPEPALIYLSQVLERFPEFEIEQLSWRVAKLDSAASGAQAAAARPSTTPDQKADGPGNLAEQLEISGRVNATNSSDYRAITAQVQRFVDALLTDARYELVDRRLPFDITSEGVLTGDIGTTQPGQAARFSVLIARRLP